MMAELAPPRIAKGKENITALTLHIDYPSWLFGIQINQI